MKGARIPRYRRDMYGAAAGLPPTLARSGDCTPTVMNDHPICIYTDTRTSVSIWIGAPPPYPKEGSGPRARALIFTALIFTSWPRAPCSE
jgi:hypothetical protein